MFRQQALSEAGRGDPAVRLSLKGTVLSTIPPDQTGMSVKSWNLCQIAKSALYVRKSLYMMEG